MDVKPATPDWTPHVNAYEMSPRNHGGGPGSERSDVRTVDREPIATGESSQSDVPLSIQELPPVDRGRQAWTFCFCNFVVETLVWGFGFR